MRNRGITLIALIITIVILLILAGITLGTLKGRNGLIKKADEADLKTTHLGVKEKIEFLALQKESYRDETDFIEYLKSKEYIDDNGIIDTKKVFDKKTNYGNGTNEKDVYKIEKDDKYILNYYDKSGVATEIWSMKNDTISVGDNNEPEEGEKIAEVSWIYYEGSNGDLTITGFTKGDFSSVCEDIYDHPSVFLDADVLKFPSYIDGKKVIGVDFNVTDWSSLTVNGPKKLVFGDTIEYIDGSQNASHIAYVLFEGFESVKLSQNLKRLDRVYFSSTALTSITIPKSLTRLPSDTFNRGTFCSCPNLTITLEKGSTLQIPSDNWGAKDVIREQ